MAILDKWQTILLTSWKWQLLVGTSLGGLLLLIVGLWLLRRRRRRRLAMDGADLMFSAPAEPVEQPTVSFRDDWADPYAPAAATSVVEVDEVVITEAEPPAQVVEAGPTGEVELVAANDAWHMPADDVDTVSNGDHHREPGEVERRVAKLEAAVVALTDLLRPARAADTGAELTERLDALEQTLTARFDALARVLTSLPTGSALPGFGADPEAVASAVIEIRRTLRG